MEKTTMHQMTNEELVLVAGGTHTHSDDCPWWHDAFSWLSDSLSWLGDATGGWLGDYIGGFGDVADGMTDNGDMIWDRAYGYNDYCIDQQSNGDECLPFDEWVEQGGGG
jgi:hypothetical protein